jgi:hypothetical protein
LKPILFALQSRDAKIDGDNCKKVHRMPEPWLSFPVVCPQCGTEELFNLPVANIAAALLTGTPIRLSAACHHLWWNADRIEQEQLREYLASVVGISVQRAYPPDKAGSVLPVAG